MAHRKATSFPRVLFAECRRVLFTRGTLTAYPVFFLISIGVGAGLELSIRANGANTFGMLEACSVAEMAMCAFAALSCLYAIARVGRDYTDGSMQFVSAMVPLRGRLHAARLVSWGLPAAIGTAAVAAAILGYNGNAGIDGIFDTGIMGAVVGLGAASAFLTTAISVAIASLSKRSWVAALIWIALFAALPAAFWAGMNAGGDMQGIFESLFYATPSIGFYSAVRLSAADPGIIWQGCAVIAAWSLLLIAWSGISFSQDSLSQRLEK